MLFQVHPNGRVKFSGDGALYFDTVENFHADGSIVLPGLADGAGIMITESRSAMFYNGSQTAAGELWDSCATDAIANIGSYIAAQAERRENEAA